MGSVELLVDADVVSYMAWMRPQAEPFAPLWQGKLLAISFVTVGEMFYSAMKANWGGRRINKMAAIIKRYTVIPGTYGIAEFYGKVKRTFHDQVDENDMWIAATALAIDLANGRIHS